MKLEASTGHHFYRHGSFSWISTCLARRAKSAGSYTGT
jgi:hypothetical protein